MSLKKLNSTLLPQESGVEIKKDSEPASVDPHPQPSPSGRGSITACSNSRRTVADKRDSKT